MRLGDRGALEQAAHDHHRDWPDNESQLRKAKARWIDGLAGSAPHVDVASAAAALEELGYRSPAADAYADAAILAARASADSDAELQARRLYEAIGMHPLLGQLPETRWLNADAISGEATSA